MASFIVETRDFHSRRSHTLSVKRGEGLVCLASTSCAEGMQFKCNTSGEARAAHAISASATANKRNRLCVYVQYTRLQPPLVPPEFGSQGKYLQPYRPDE